MTIYYWIGPTAKNFNDTSAWSLSSGGASAAAAPGAADVAVFDNKTTAQCTLTAAVSLLGLDFQGGSGGGGVFQGTFIQNATFNITITGTGANALRFAPAPMNYAPAATTAGIIMANTTGVAGLTCAGQKLAALTLSGAGGTTQLQDDLYVTGATGATLTVTFGTLDCNTTVGCKVFYNAFSSSNSNARGVTQAGDWTFMGGIASNGQPWLTSTLTLMNWVKNSANMIFNGPLTQIVGWQFSFGNLALNNMTFSAGSTTQIATFNQSVTCNNLTFGSGWIVAATAAGVAFNLSAGSNFALNGTAAVPCAMGVFATSASLGVVCSSTGNATASFASMWNVGFSGGGSFTATNCLNVGNNSNSIAWVNSLVPPSTPAQLATALWQDLLSSSDFSTAGSVGALLKAMGNLQFTAQDIGRGTVASGATLTSIPTSAMTPTGADVDQFAQGIVVFDSNTTTAALRSKRALISASTNAANPTLTVSALKTAPAAGDTFSIL